MTIDWEALARAQTLVKPEPLAGDFLVLVDRLGHVDLATRFKGGEEVNPAIRRVLGNFRPLWEDFTALLTLVYRLDRELEERDAGRLDEFSWFAFSRLDVEMFFIKFRSLFDHLAGIAQALAIGPNETKNSFSAMRKLAASKKRSEELPRLIRELIADCAWFDELCSWRDSLTHTSGHIRTFKESGQLPFQLYVSQRAEGLQLPGLMLNDNVVDFRLFGAAYLSRLLVLLDELALVLMEIFEIAETGADPRTSSAGIPYLVDWFDRLAKLRPQSTP